MSAEITRLMVEVAVGQGLRELRTQFNRRILRNAVEHGGRFSHGGFQRMLFQTMQEMLRSDDHPYYALCSRVAQEVDERYLLGYGVNMGFESWTNGAKVIRRLEAEECCNIPWCLTLCLSQGTRTMAFDTACALIDQGMALGVMSYLIEEEAARPDVLRALCDRYSACALTAFLPDEEINDALLAALAGTDNLALVAVRRTGAFASAEVMRAYHRLYGLCREYDEPTAEAVMAGGDLYPLGAPDAPVPVFRPSPGCSEAVCQRFNEYLLEKKKHPTQPVFPIELSHDLARVDQVISTDDCALALAVDGTYLVGDRQQPTGLTFPETALHEAVRALLKK